MKKLLAIISLGFVFGAAGCEAVSKNVSDGKTNNQTNSTPSTTVNRSVDPTVNPNTAQTPHANKTEINTQKKVESTEPLPHKIDDQTAVSPVYKLNSKSCKNSDDLAGEGDEYNRECKAYSDYSLYITGSDYRINYSIASKNPKTPIDVMLFPLENGDADEYRWANKYDTKLDDKIQWILDDKGKPFAVFVHASYYKNTGSAKTFDNPKNKVAEFVLLRGLVGWEEIDTDIATKDVAYNPDEWARKIAYEVREKKTAN